MSNIIHENEIFYTIYYTRKRDFIHNEFTRKREFSRIEFTQKQDFRSAEWRCIHGTIKKIIQSILTVKEDKKNSL